MVFSSLEAPLPLAPLQGGKHVDHVVDPLVAKIAESVKKKNKGGMELRPFQIKSHMWVFVNCLIENPAFDSQTKENMTLKQSAFGSKFEPSDKFFKDVSWNREGEELEPDNTCVVANSVRQTAHENHPVILFVQNRSSRVVLWRTVLHGHRPSQKCS